MAIDTSKRNKKMQEWKTENRDRINLLFTKGFKERLQAAAAGVGESMSSYVEKAVNYRIDNDIMYNSNIKDIPQNNNISDQDKEQNNINIILPDYININNTNEITLYLLDKGYSDKAITDYINSISK